MYVCFVGSWHLQDCHGYGSLTFLFSTDIRFFSLSGIHNDVKIYIGADTKYREKLFKKILLLVEAHVMIVLKVYTI